jgi:hypothetical protein
VGLCCLAGMDLDLRRIKSNDSKSLPRPGRFSVLQPNKLCMLSAARQRDPPSLRCLGSSNLGFVRFGERSVVMVCGSFLQRKIS